MKHAWTMAIAVAVCLWAGAASAQELAGWPADALTAQDGGFLPGAEGAYSTAEWGNFELSGQFRLAAGSAGGVVVRAAADGVPGYNGPRVQLVDHSAPPRAYLDPYYASGAIRGRVASTGAQLVNPGEWNNLIIAVVGQQVRVTINGTQTAEATLPDMAASGRIGLIAGEGPVLFRNVQVVAMDTMPLGTDEINKAQPGDNVPPEGFVALFNGVNLDGWKGLVASPPQRAAMTADELATAQAAADQRMRDHWKVVDGVLVFDGGGDSLCTIKDYGDFEMLVDWKILPHGDSGIYLRGSPQVQIWDTADWPEGSGGLYNNQNNPSKPSVAADRPIGQWNSMRIRMIGEKVWVWLNDILVVDNVTMENYWERDKPIYPTGQLELQNHGNTLWFKNVYVREITDPAAEQ